MDEDVSIVSQIFFCIKQFKFQLLHRLNYDNNKTRNIVLLKQNSWNQIIVFFFITVLGSKIENNMSM